MHGFVLAQKVQDDTVGLGRTAASSSGLVPKLYAALTFAFAGAGASYLFLSNETLTVRGPALMLVQEVGTLSGPMQWGLKEMNAMMMVKWDC